MRLASILALLVATTASAAPLRDGEGFAVSNGVRIWYRVEGASSTGVPLLIYHGGPGETARPFERTIGPKLARTRPIIYTDYRGAGRSDRPQSPSAYSFAQLADDGEAVRQHLGIASWAVFGHSNGGATAITYALRHPTSTRALVLCDPLSNSRDLEANMAHKVARALPQQRDGLRAVYLSKAPLAERFDKMFPLLEPGWDKRLMFVDPAAAERFTAMQDELARELHRSLMAPQLPEGLMASGFFSFDAFAHAREMTLPVLVLVGSVDRELSVDNAAALAATLPNGRFVSIDRSGHFPFVEQPDATAAAIEAFLRDLR